MFCTFIFAVLLLKTVFLLVISYKDIALQIFLTVAKSLITDTYYLMAWLNKANDTRQAWSHRWPALLTILNKIPFISMK